MLTIDLPRVGGEVVQDNQSALKKVNVNPELPGPTCQPLCTPIRSRLTKLTPLQSSTVLVWPPPSGIIILADMSRDPALSFRNRRAVMSQPGLTFKEKRLGEPPARPLFRAPVLIPSTLTPLKTGFRL